jgi:hypothetical protein
MGLSIATLLHRSGAKVPLRLSTSQLIRILIHLTQFDIPNAIGCTLMHYVAGEEHTSGASII